MSDRKLRVQIDRAAARARERFGLPAMARAYAALYHRVAPVARRRDTVVTPIARSSS